MTAHFRLTAVCSGCTVSTMTLADHLKQRRGSASDLARALCVKHSTVLRWAANRVPADRVEAVARATGIDAGVLRPDLAKAFERTT